MNTDDLFNSSSLPSPSAENSKDPDFINFISDDHKLSSSLIVNEACSIIDVDQSLSVQKENVASKAKGMANISNDAKKKNIEENASHFFINGSIYIPNEDIPNFEKHRVFILQMATFFQTGNISESLLALLIVQNSSLDLDHLTDAILKIADPSPEHLVQKLEIHGKIQKLADWEYYGIEGALENEQVSQYLYQMTNLYR